MPKAFSKIDKGKTMQEMWEGFAELTMPKDAPFVQRTEMKNAFFAGGLTLFNWFMTQLEEGEEATDADFDLTSKMFDELTEHFSKIGQR